jgi:hypothetical protein
MTRWDLKFSRPLLCCCRSLVSEKHAVSLLVRIQFPYSLPLIGSLPSALALQVLYKPSTSLPCHFSPWRWRQRVCPKRRHRPANPCGARTKDFYNKKTVDCFRHKLIKHSFKNFKKYEFYWSFENSNYIFVGVLRVSAHEASLWVWWTCNRALTLFSTVVTVCAICFDVLHSAHTAWIIMTTLYACIWDVRFSRRWRCDAVWTCRWLPTFRKSVSHVSPFLRVNLQN